MDRIYNVVKKNGNEIVDVYEGVKDLGHLEVSYKYKITEVNIPSSVENIGAWAFCEMLDVKCFNVSPENAHFVEMDGCIYSADMSTLVAYPPNKVCECFEIPSPVKAIAPGAFRGANQLKCVKIGENVKTIGYEAFGGTYSIERIYIDEGVETIEYLLQECVDLDLYISYRVDLVIGGATGSAIERWCDEHAVRFCPLEDNQIEDFLVSPVWNYAAPPLDEDKCWECLERSLEKTEVEYE